MAKLFHPPPQLNKHQEKIGESGSNNMFSIHTGDEAC